MASGRSRGSMDCATAASRRITTIAAIMYLVYYSNNGAPRPDDHRHTTANGRRRPSGIGEGRAEPVAGVGELPTERRDHRRRCVLEFLAGAFGIRYALQFQQLPARQCQRGGDDDSRRNQRSQQGISGMDQTAGDLSPRSEPSESEKCQVCVRRGLRTGLLPSAWHHVLEHPDVACSLSRKKGDLLAVWRQPNAIPGEPLANVNIQLTRS